MLCWPAGKNWISHRQWIKLIACRQQEESVALFEDFKPPDDPIFQDDFMIEEYDTDDVLDVTLDLFWPLDN
jgi:hypothetical protein